MWTNDARLEADSVLIFETDTLQWRLFDDHRYPWLILIPKVPHVTELFELSDECQKTLLSSANRAARHLLADFDCDKVNSGYLGNVVSQLHYHVVGRRKDDPAWPGPVWGHSPRDAYQPDTLQQHIDKWRILLADLAVKN